MMLIIVLQVSSSIKDDNQKPQFLRIIQQKLTCFISSFILYSKRTLLTLANKEKPMTKKALVFYGGWDGHEPHQVAEHFKQLLEQAGCEVDLYDDLSCLDNKESLMTYHVFVPIWTMGELTKERSENISEAIGAGAGLIGCHGGMCDAFRSNVLWQFITGGNWVSHPGGDGVPYKVEFTNASSSLTEGFSDFEVKSEHYYLHVDPCVEVLATTRFPNVHWYHSTNKAVAMPVIWTKRWGHGRVYYTSLGHHADIIQETQVSQLLERGINWVIEGKDIALSQQLSADVFKSNVSMY